MNISDLIPDKVKALVNAILDKAGDLLQGETLRAIQYGGAALLFGLGKAFQIIPDVSFPEAVGQTVAASVVVITFVESARHYVWSPKSVAAITATIPAGSSDPSIGAV